MSLQEALYEFGHASMQIVTPGHDHAEADCRLRVQPLKVLKVSIEERVLIVPLDLKRQHTPAALTDMVDLVGYGFARRPVNN